ncbi:minor extracellular protease vpr protein [Ceratobasidium sp. AG-Ba]|nr:minor extracellular protease vpr protein [Ceratobasidium sp. AG-Ba]
MTLSTNVTDTVHIWRDHCCQRKQLIRRSRNCRPSITKCVSCVLLPRRHKRCYPGRGSPARAVTVTLVTQAIPQGLTVSFPNNPSTVDVPEGGLMSSFSTYDPTNDMYFKPRVETFPRPLLLQVKGKTTATAKAARTLFENMAILVKQTATNTSLLETASHQGAGLVQVYDVIHATGTLIPAGILLNDTAKFKSVHTIFVKTRKRRR